MVRKNETTQEGVSDERTQIAADGPTAAGAAYASLVVIHGDRLGERIKLEQDCLVIGRAPETDLPIDQSSISRRHCEIVRDGEGYKLRDLDSTNRTYLNDQPVIEAWLTDGDHITVGQTILKFLGAGNLEAQYHSEVHQRSVLDPLTGLYNRRYFLDILEREAARAKRHDRNFSLCILDIDHFKRINDELGHLGGDAVLKDLCQLLRQRTRKDDVAARIGGEEFAWVLPETELNDALELAEALRLAVEHHRFVADGQHVAVTVSAGCAQWQPEMHHTDELYRKADEALYQAKREGRNQVCDAA